MESYSLVLDGEKLECEHLCPSMVLDWKLQLLFLSLEMDLLEDAHLLQFRKRKLGLRFSVLEPCPSLVAMNVQL